ncbi:MAG: septal ring lytic transglycosylase RlpA family protein [Bacteroidetes bacterium]|nr:septal ring lytic transglycosylase RlpA family protein [Bacteroidota bacterium]
MVLFKKLILLFFLSVNFINFCVAQEKYTQTGLASYYSDAFNGRFTSSGEKYNNKLYTAAHATLKFHTLVKITNIYNNKTVIVEINDRCAKYKNRIIDLSKAAAKQIDLLTSGIASVKLEVITPADLNIIGNFPDTLLIKYK